ncbi:DNA polymerase III subunit delta' [Flavobacteriales bacterium]|nr:DNA polymerase III subunit delta' [Flavobacteriales bacterium]
MLFKEIVGNLTTKGHLIKAAENNRVSHAQLFSGKSGSAKLAIALAYAQFLNCENRTKEDSCNTCSSCLKYNNLSHPDLHIIIPVLKINNIKNPISDHFIKQWREFIGDNYYGSLNDWADFFGPKNKTGQQGTIYVEEAKDIRKKLSLKNYEANYRVVLIWMPERMEVKTSNKLLKLFEEPPKGTIFILVSENASQLLPTINSRIQTIRIADFTTEDIVSYFSNKRLSSEKAKQLINLTDSDLGKIIKILNEKEANIDLFNNFSTWMRLSYKMDVQGISKWVEEISRKGRKQQKLFLSYAIKMVRECIIYNFASNSLLKTNKTELTFLTKFSPFIHEKNSVLITEKLEESIKASNRNANAKVLFFELSLQMARILKLKCKFAVK